MTDDKNPVSSLRIIFYMALGSLAGGGIFYGVSSAYFNSTTLGKQNEILQKLKENAQPMTRTLVIEDCDTTQAGNKCRFIDTVGYYIPAKDFKLE